MKTIKIDEKDAAQAAHVLRLRVAEHREKHPDNTLVESMCVRLERVADAMDPPDPFRPLIHVHVGGKDA
jgi:hypothetical protein